MNQRNLDLSLLKSENQKDNLLNWYKFKPNWRDIEGREIRWLLSRGRRKCRYWHFCQYSLFFKNEPQYMGCLIFGVFRNSYCMLHKQGFLGGDEFNE